MRVLFFYLLLASLVAITFWRGKTDERVAAGICVAGTLLTVLVGNKLEVGTSSFDIAAFLVDAGVFAAFLLLAMRSDRFWPLWVAGLQLTTTTVHLLMMLSPAMPGMVFGAALAFWSYPIVLLIALGALRTPRIERWREAREIAPPQVIT
nr:hypothetical protein [uncultured Sphingomonas sp.]